jgi:hypothetical protein
MTTEVTSKLTISEFIDALDTSPTINIGAERTFSTGSRGYTINCRIVVNGKQYIGTMNLVEVGSKPRNGDATPRGANPEHAAATENGPVTTTRRSNRNRE